MQNGRFLLTEWHSAQLIGLLSLVTIQPNEVLDFEKCDLKITAGLSKATLVDRKEANSGLVVSKW